MTEPNLRPILVAFNEKGWELYDVCDSEGETTHPGVQHEGPIDNLMPGIFYALMPVNDDKPGVCMRGVLKRAGKGPGYNLREADDPYWINFWGIIIKGDDLLLDNLHPIPLEGAEDELRKRLKPYDAEEGKMLLTAEESRRQGTGWPSQR